MTVFSTKPVVDIEDVIVVIIVVAIVVGGLARLCKDATGVVCGLVSELGVADAIGVEDVSGKMPQWRKICAVSAHSPAVQRCVGIWL